MQTEIGHVRTLGSVFYALLVVSCTGDARQFCCMSAKAQYCAKLRHEQRVCGETSCRNDALCSNWGDKRQIFSI